MKAARYIKAIKNTRKQAYAVLYWRYLTEGGEAPTAPDDLSVMAAQAVRMNLDEQFADDAIDTRTSALTAWERNK